MLKELKFEELFQRIDEQLNTNEEIKTFFIDILKDSIAKKDYMQLIDKTKEVFSLDNKETQLFLGIMSDHEGFDYLKSIENLSNKKFLTLLRITYGISIHETRAYTTNENKLLISEIIEYPHNDKISYNIKRLDQESFYYEIGISNVLPIINRSLNSYIKLLNKTSEDYDKDLILEDTIMIKKAIYDIQGIVNSRGE